MSHTNTQPQAPATTASTAPAPKDQTPAKPFDARTATKGERAAKARELGIRIKNY
jgi:hypothetical protein